jgi:hypothetical protein
MLDSLRTCDGVDAGRQEVGLGLDPITGFGSAEAADEADATRIQLVNEMRNHAADKLDRTLDNVQVQEVTVEARRALQLRSRALEAGDIDVVMTLDPEDTMQSNLVERNALEAALTEAPASGSLVSVSGVSSAVMVPTCGNDVCEAGERPNTAAGITGCAADCAFPVVACPASNGAECNNKGVCVSGVCQCHTSMGYSGRACDECVSGFTRINGACVRTTFTASEPEPEPSSSPAPPAAPVSDENGTPVMLIVAAIVGVVALGVVTAFVVRFVKNKQEGARVKPGHTVVGGHGQPVVG